MKARSLLLWLCVLMVAFSGLLYAFEETTPEHLLTNLEDFVNEVNKITP